MRYRGTSSREIASIVRTPFDMLVVSTICISIHTYGLEIQEFLARDIRNIHFAMTDGIQKIVG